MNDSQILAKSNLRYEPLSGEGIDGMFNSEMDQTPFTLGIKSIRSNSD